MERASDPMNRRAALELFGAFGALATLAGCGADAALSSTTTDAGDGALGADGSSAADGGAVECTVIPEETAGPYPDKTGMLTNAQFYRKDITEGKTGLPLTLTLKIVKASAGCAAMANANVIIWHCDKDGIYSEYSGQPGVTTDETATTFLRGVQTSDANGQVTFTTIFPGWYQGRATHIHVEVYPDGSTSTPSKTTQIAFPDAVNTQVYATSLYSKGPSTTTDTSDMVFSDGDTHQIPILVGDVNTGYTATLQIDA
jgi:protocatechuate 3,4-dioxygenase beta subunit